jgi:MoxR-like ATPase
MTVEIFDHPGVGKTTGARVLAERLFGDPARFGTVAVST